MPGGQFSTQEFLQLAGRLLKDLGQRGPTFVGEWGNFGFVPVREAPAEETIGKSF